METVTKEIKVNLCVTTHCKYMGAGFFADSQCYWGLRLLERKKRISRRYTINDERCINDLTVEAGFRDGG
jgi:hypothetical protein